MYGFDLWNSREMREERCELLSMFQPNVFALLCSSFKVSRQYAASRFVVIVEVSKVSNSRDALSKRDSTMT